jgi:hypothetical protein
LRILRAEQEVQLSAIRTEAVGPGITLPNPLTHSTLGGASRGELKVGRADGDGDPGSGGGGARGKGLPSSPKHRRRQVVRTWPLQPRGFAQSGRVAAATSCQRRRTTRAGLGAAQRELADRTFAAAATFRRLAGDGWRNALVAGGAAATRKLTPRRSKRSTPLRITLFGRELAGDGSITRPTPHQGAWRKSLSPHRSSHDGICAKLSMAEGWVLCGCGVLPKTWPPSAATLRAATTEQSCP